MTTGKKRLKALVVFGTRPEAIKMVPVIQELKRRPSFECIVAVTGQHREMLNQVLSLFNCAPDVDLSIMSERQSLQDITSRVLYGVSGVIGEFRPDMVLVQGDTTTTFAAALAAYYSGKKVGHVEAGLRTWNKANPFPEEMNRRLTGSIADYHFAPTENARENLLKEGIGPGHIFMTGNTVIDALRQIASMEYEFEDPGLKGIDFEGRRVIVLTTHRRESFGGPMESVLSAVNSIVEDFNDVEVVFPMHKNPNVREAVKKVINGNGRIHLVEPVEYLPFVHLMSRAHLILTDSGGVQEEAPSLGKPVLVLRDTTERPEGVHAGTARLVGTSRERIIREASLLLRDEKEYRAMANAVNPYGDGRASVYIADALESLGGFV
jgi:UDP-N-acetylglucosamine 2-epimerase (non-hydrolysing)